MLEDSDIRTDPSLDPVEVARDRTLRDIDGIVDNTIMELGHARNELDNLMNDIAKEREDVKRAVIRIATFSAKAIRAKVIIADSLVKLRQEDR